LLYCPVLLNSNPITKGIEHIPIENPVYGFLQRMENKGNTGNSALSKLPLQRIEVVNLLNKIKSNFSQLTEFEKSTLELYLLEFYINKPKETALIYSDSIKSQVFNYPDFFESNEKYVYRSEDKSNRFNLKPLAKGEYRKEFTDSNRASSIINYGFRFYGNIGDNFGYYLLATNGSVRGSRSLAAEDPRISQITKFTYFNSDLDYTESHIHYTNSWFNFSIGRENRLLGNGINTRLYQSSFAPPTDALELASKFDNFHYTFTYGSVLSYSDSSWAAGYGTVFPSKFIASHRFSLRPSWGEIALWESVVFNNRYFDIAYLNPLSFFKATEHALKDRDNTLLGADFNVRPLSGLSIRGSYILDDIIFDKIGTGFWSNKAAMNLGAEYSFDNFDLGFEYTRIEPYTFSHFNIHNSYTNDRRPYGSQLQPNSELWHTHLSYWYGNRYPITLQLQYQRHGRNVFDSQGNLIKNVGGDILQTIRFGTDPIVVTFLDGDLVSSFIANLIFRYEIIRSFNITIIAGLNNTNGKVSNTGRFIIAYEDF